MPYNTGRIVAARLFTAALLLTGAATADAQTVSEPISPEVLGRIQGPPPPDPPVLGAVDAEGRLTIRAVRLSAPLTTDGQLDEDLYRSFVPVSNFIQVEPNPDLPATEKTEFWIAFDRTTFYISWRVWESQPDRMIVTEMRRDNITILQNEHVAFLLDPFYSRRNSFQFMINHNGGRMDGETTNERQYNADLNPIWDIAIGKFDGGWTAEAAIPFKSLRYPPGREQIWGFTGRRVSRWKNEIAYTQPMPKGIALFGIMRASNASTIVGIEAPPPRRSLEVKPYAVADLTTDLAARPAVSDDTGGDFGVDVKYGVTQSVTADFTYNTDFAQVEADEQQINLTRFSLFFPEKREFFLENRGTFEFGGTTGGGGDTPTLFYTRRIGLQAGRAVPIDAGGRLTGRIGRYSLGVLNVQSGDDPVGGARATNFAVARLKRDILRRSSIGAVVTRRSVRERGTGSNESFGMDGSFAFFQNLVFNTYWARTRTAGLTGDDTSYRTHLDYNADELGVQLDHLAIGDDFNPEIGFLRRDDMRKSYGLFRFSPRPEGMAAIRKFSFTASMNYIENGAGRLETRDWDTEGGIEFENSDRVSVSYNNIYEFLPQPFGIAPGVLLPIGGYDFSTVRAAYTFGQHRVMSGTLSIEDGTFYSGNRLTFAASGGRVELTPQFTMQPTASVNRIDLAEGSFTSTLVGSRVTYTMTPLMFASALVQYNTTAHAVSSNIRLRWEYQPGSELFVVYNEQRDTLARAFPDLVNRALIVKINRLLRF